MEDMGEYEEPIHLGELIFPPGFFSKVQSVDPEYFKCLVLTADRLNREAGREVFRVCLYPAEPRAGIVDITIGSSEDVGTTRLRDGAEALRRSLHPDQDTL